MMASVWSLMKSRSQSALKNPEHELPLPITHNYDEESSESTQWDEEENEMALPSMSTPKQFHVISSEDIWIADTGTMVHNTPYKNGGAK